MQYSLFDLFRQLRSPSCESSWTCHRYYPKTDLDRVPYIPLPTSSRSRYLTTPSVKGQWKIEYGQYSSWRLAYPFDKEPSPPFRVLVWTVMDFLNLEKTVLTDEGIKQVEDGKVKKINCLLFLFFIVITLVKVKRLLILCMRFSASLKVLCIQFSVTYFS